MKNAELKDTEILVKPRGTGGADPFIIDEKDYDAAAYVKVNATKQNLEIVADQAPRETLTEQAESVQDAKLEAKNVLRKDAESKKEK